jgi:UDPglucose 6-dehydrogenase
VAGKTLAVWGLSFKANTDDIRESAALALIDELTGQGMNVQAYDPEAGDRARQWYADNALVEIGTDSYGVLDGAHALAVATEWNQFRNPDFAGIKRRLSAPVIFDGRNLYHPEHLAGQGFAYFCIGRPMAVRDE